jgi:alkylhydroperoxidase family enzyme
MTRIELIGERSANPFVRFAYRASRRNLGRDVDPVGVYAYAPRLMIGYGAFEQATSREHRVEERLKVLAETKAAAVVNCEFCCDIASSIAREAGVTEAQLLALPDYRDSDEFTALEKLVLDYATAISRTPTVVDDELFAALREHFDERQMVELTNVIALENMRARFNSAFAMTPAGFSDGMVCAVPEAAPAATAAETAATAATAATADPAPGREQTPVGTTA